MPVVKFEAADSADTTAIGEGLTRLARTADRLLVDVSVGKYALDHSDGCSVCERGIDPGATFYLDADAGEVLCETHGRQRRGDAD